MPERWEVRRYFNHKWSEHEAFFDDEQSALNYANVVLILALEPGAKEANVGRVFMEEGVVYYSPNHYAD